MITLTKSALRYLLKHNFQADYLNQQALSYLKSCRQILDVGCGTGEFIRLSPKQIIGIDANRQTLKLCRQKGFKVKFGSAVKIPYPRNSFDGLHCSHVIEHLEPKQVYLFLKQASRVLQKNGLVVLRSPLLWRGFYHNLTHIKPYPPQAITRYLVETAPDTTFPPIKSRFKQIALHWRYRPLLNFLYPLGIHTLKKDGYMLVLKKVS